MAQFSIHLPEIVRLQAESIGHWKHDFCFQELSRNPVVRDSNSRFFSRSPERKTARVGAMGLLPAAR